MKEPRHPRAFDPRGTPARIGRYRILETLGEGGMGIVYLAEQDSPIRRLVALKLVKPGANTAAILRRFEVERQTLARMAHPNVAGIYDAGATEFGQPYFAMEYVDGMPLTTYCDARRVSLRDRLELFLGVCAGVQHAHQRAALHRDLKPSNVLVTEVDGHPVPKVIDFGLARAMESDAGAVTELTQDGDFLGTPVYMSPEQADTSSRGIDTRTDVYSLGVMLYELLSGSLPFASPSTSRESRFEYLRRVQETEPQRPSARVTAPGAGSTTIAELRRTDVRSLARRLRGDLDWITLRALERERDRRYPSVAALAADVQKHLRHEPVVAGPPSVLYRVRKFVRRRRGLVAALFVIALVLVGSTVTSTTFALAADAHLTNFQRLSFVERLETAIQRERTLYPAWPGNADAMRTWLDEEAGPLLAARDPLRRTVASLEARVPPLTPAESAGQRRTHRRAEELATRQARLAALRKAHAVRTGEMTPEPFELDPGLPELLLRALDENARQLVLPDRTIFGREAEGLALARRAVAAANSREKYVVTGTLAWALFALGLDEEARDAGRDALARAPATQRTVYEGYLEDLEKAITAAEGEAGTRAIQSLEAEIAVLQAEVAKRHDFRFDDPAIDFLHATLSTLIDRISAFGREQVADVRRRLAWADSITDLSIEHHRARWDEARAALRRADGVTASELYAEVPIDLEPQTGLVPIGMNPRTKLWEFYHLRSAWMRSEDIPPDGLVIPEHHDDGTLETARSGLVFVLVPGGTFRLGAQNHAEDAPNYDAGALPDEQPVREVRLAPFFLSKYEMTRRQWACLTDGGDPGWLQLGALYTGNTDPIRDWHPVESVTWADCDALLRRHGLVLPTEAQWEYGCRAGTTTPWFCGEEATSLCGFANLRDRQHARGTGQPAPSTMYDDGWAASAPVGSYEPNSWGLYDTCGNVSEWCRDGYGDAYYYLAEFRDGDSLQVSGAPTEGYVVRGGSSDESGTEMRSASRSSALPSHRAFTLGVRPSRPVLP